MRESTISAARFASPPLAALLLAAFGCAVVVAPAAAASAASAASGQTAEAAVGFRSVAAARAALRADPTAQFQEQRGWTVVATREDGNPVEWFFTPKGHPAHPAVVKRTVVNDGATGYVELAALCEAAQQACDALIEGFKQFPEPKRAPPPELVTLDVAVKMNDHDRVQVRRLAAEAGKAAEIRMDDVFKVVIVPTLDDGGDVTLWTAMYEFDGSDFVLMAAPQLAQAHGGTAEIDVAAKSGVKFGFFITPVAVPRAAAL